MALSFKTGFDTEEIKRNIQDRLDKIEAAIINRLKYTGEEFVKNARTNANFKDHTGNLRASIGYAILKNGERVEESITGGVGGTAATNVISEVGAAFPKGFVLLVVAGMEYAAAVESQSLDVLTSSSLLAEAALKQAIAALNNKIALLP